jgi:transcriptional/translational regulatory protein YebC/TACO1
MEEDEGKYLFYFPKEILVNLNTLIQDTGFTLIESSLCYIPENPIEIPSEHLDKNNQLIQKLKDHQDVQEIFYNF